MKNDLWWKKYALATKIEGAIIVITAVLTFMKREPILDMFLSLNMLIFTALLGFEQQFKKNKLLLAICLYFVGITALIALVSQIDLFISGVQ